MLFSILEEVRVTQNTGRQRAPGTNLLAKGEENATLGTEEILLHFRVVAILNKEERRSLSDLKLEEKPCLTRNLHDRDFDTMEPRQELKLSYQKEKYETTTPRWKTNMRLMQHRIKDRFRVAIASHSFLKQKSQMPGGIGTPAWRATATGLVVARVFQDNSVMARVARSMAKREWQKRSGWLNAWPPKIRSMLGLSVNGGALSSEGETSLAEALMLQPLVGEMDTNSVDRKGRRKQLELHEGVLKMDILEVIHLPKKLMVKNHWGFNVQDKLWKVLWSKDSAASESSKQNLLWAPGFFTSQICSSHFCREGHRYRKRTFTNMADAAGSDVALRCQQLPCLYALAQFNWGMEDILVNPGVDIVAHNYHL